MISCKIPFDIVKAQLAPGYTISVYGGLQGYRGYKVRNAEGDRHCGVEADLDCPLGLYFDVLKNGDLSLKISERYMTLDILARLRKLQRAWSYDFNIKGLDAWKAKVRKV